jgi:hypothetical protein
MKSWETFTFTNPIRAKNKGEILAAIYRENGPLAVKFVPFD